MHPAAPDQIGVAPVGHARVLWSFLLDNVEDKAAESTACISPPCSHARFVAFEAGGTHGMVAHIWGGYNVTTSPLRWLDSLLGDTGRYWRGGDRGLFFSGRSF